MKGVCIWSYSCPHFPAFRLNADRYSKCGKIRTRITPNTGTFYVVAIKTLKTNKAPEADEILAEALKMVGKTLAKHCTTSKLFGLKRLHQKTGMIRSLCQSSGKGPESEFSDHREISLLSVAGKVFTTYKKSHCCVREANMREPQAGFH